CNGLEPCISCEAAGIPCTYLTLNASKKRAHDAYVLLKKQEQAQRLKSADIIVARMGQLDIAGTSNNFGPILSQVINLPRYEAPPSDFKNDTEQIKTIGPAEEMLIDCYFKHFNYYIPILSRKSFVASIQDPEKLATVEVQKLLACVLATGFGFRRELGDPDMIRKMEPNYGLTMCRKFHHFNAQDVLNSSIENCQCYLILTGFYSSNANYDAVHNLVALAHSVAAGLGLNRVKGLYYQMSSYKGVEHTTDTLEIGRRIFWSVVIVCSGYSLSHQSPFITENDYDIPFPTRLVSDQCPDFMGIMQDDFEGIKDLHHFVPMYEITSRVADITCTATRQRPHTKVDEVRDMLVEWRTKTLPKELRITPTDMDAIRRQSRFSKFYHAVAYMFEICLHHTFQLHESHRELGVHGIWSSYCYDAAVAIKNIYTTRPMSGMNAHVILPVAAGAFANIVASKLLGKEESAQRYCDEIKVMLEEIVRASTSVERNQLVNFVSHGYNGVTKNTKEKVESFKIDAPGTPPWNERSSNYTESSPGQSTGITGDSDASDDEQDNVDDQDDQDDEDNDTQLTSDHEDSDKRMTGHFVPSVVPQSQQGFLRQMAPQQQQQQQQQHQQHTQHVLHSHQVQHHHTGIPTHNNTHNNTDANVYTLHSQEQHHHQQQQQQPQQLAYQQHHHHQQQQQTLPYSSQVTHHSRFARETHPVIQTSHVHSGYNGMVPMSASSNSASTLGFSPSGLSSAGTSDHAQQQQQQQQQTQLKQQRQQNNVISPVDSGFSSSHGYDLNSPGHDTYFVSQHDSQMNRGQQQQQHQLRSQQQAQDRFMQQQHPHHSGIPSSASGSSGPYPNVSTLDGFDDGGVGFIGTPYDQQQGVWQQELNEAQLNKISEYRAILASGRQFSPEEIQELAEELHQQIIALDSGPPPHQQQHQQQQQLHTRASAGS
ncbi:hypothetical protein BGZ94_008749, partial [Podila epigama]